MFTPCLICNRHVHTHSRKLMCSICKKYLHVKCLDYNLASNICSENNYFCNCCTQTNLPFNHFNDDSDFLSAILEGPSRLTDVNCPSLLFDVLTLDNDNPFTRFDPDVSYFNGISDTSVLSSKYYSADEFNNEIKRESSKSGFSMLHINIRSVNKNLCNLIHYMETLDSSFDVIGLSETWLNGESGDCCKLTGYHAEHSFRSNKTGGGASILISENISYKRREDLTLTTDEYECVFIEIQSSSSSRDGPLTGCLYRAPN